MDRIEQMRAFAAVVAAGGFTAAAAKTGSTPQLVSKYVAALEDDLGTRLLNRTTRRVALTEAGHAYHPRAAFRCLEQFDDLRALTPRGAYSPEGTPDDRRPRHFRRAAPGARRPGLRATVAGGCRRPAPDRPLRRSGRGGRGHGHSHRPARRQRAGGPQADPTRRSCASRPPPIWRTRRRCGPLTI